MRGHFHNLDDSDELPDFQEQMIHPDFYEKIHGYKKFTTKSPSPKMPMDMLPRKLGRSTDSKEEDVNTNMLQPWRVGSQQFYPRESNYPEGYQPGPGEVDICLHPETLDWPAVAVSNPPYKIESHFSSGRWGHIKPRMREPTLPAIKERAVSPGSGRFHYDPKIAQFSHSADKIISITRARLNEEFENIFGVKLRDVLQKEREDPISYTRERISRKFQQQFGETLLEALESGKCK